MASILSLRNGACWAPSIIIILISSPACLGLQSAVNFVGKGKHHEKIKKTASLARQLRPAGSDFGPAPASRRADGLELHLERHLGRKRQSQNRPDADGWIFACSRRRLGIKCQ